MKKTKHLATIITFFALFLMLPAGLANADTGYQGSLQSFYDQCADLIYTEYIQHGYDAIFWGRIQNETEYD